MFLPRGGQSEGDSSPHPGTLKTGIYRFNQLFTRDFRRVWPPGYRRLGAAPVMFAQV